MHEQNVSFPSPLARRLNGWADWQHLKARRGRDDTDQAMGEYWFIGVYENANHGSS
jgi:hypothetical protein